VLTSRVMREAHRAREHRPPDPDLRDRRRERPASRAPRRSAAPARR
jgi:hypothetical protein